MSRTLSTPYIEWAKLQQGATYNLAISGMTHATFEDIGGAPREMPITGPNGYGYAPLLDAIARRYGVRATQVMTCTGCSMANYLALAALVAPGDEVLIERPTYEPLLRVAEHLNAVITRFDRPPEQSCILDPERVIAATTSKTRVIVVANLHNPSGQTVSDEALRLIGARAREVGARVLVDEVYLDAAFDELRWPAARLDPVFISTSSLTKVYGLAALRCGWLIADEELISRVWRVADLYGNVQPFASEWLASQAFDHLTTLRERTRDRLEGNRTAWNAWLSTRRDVESLATHQGTTVCFRPLREPAQSFSERLRERFDVSVVPGRFFELPGYVRIGLTPEPSTFRGGLARIGSCLDEITRDASAAE